MYLSFLPVVLAGSSVVLALLLSLLLFILWFFTGYYYIFVILFGLTMGSLVSATILFTPLGKTENTSLWIKYRRGREGDLEREREREGESE
jgi:hypothetical protein